MEGEEGWVQRQDWVGTGIQDVVVELVVVVLVDDVLVAVQV